MIVFGISHLKRTPGPNIHLNCGACGVRDTVARIFESEERILVFWIPMPVQRERHVVCRECGADRISDLPLDELVELEPEEVESHLRPRVSFIVQSLAVLSVLLFCFPLVGLVLGIVGMVGSRRSRGWAYYVSAVGIVLTVVLWGGLLLRSALIELRVV